MARAQTERTLRGRVAVVGIGEIHGARQQMWRQRIRGVGSFREAARRG